jgi:hypothetical protein
LFVENSGFGIEGLGFGDEGFGVQVLEFRDYDVSD